MGEGVPLIARAVGGRILGPRPGKAIVTFWQGIVEIILRVISIVSRIASFSSLTPSLDPWQKILAKTISTSRLLIKKQFSMGLYTISLQIYLHVHVSLVCNV